MLKYSGCRERGILIVTGNLTVSGSYKWDGIVLVGGTMTSNGAILSGRGRGVPPRPSSFLPPERAMTLQHTKVLIFAGPLYEDLELWYPKIRLEEEGARTVVAGTGERTYQGKRGYPLTVDANVDDLSADDFDGLVIPGGYAPDIMRRSKKLLQLTREIYEADKPVAFICHAGWVPISAGIVRGKRGTSVGAIKDDLVNAGLLWEDSPVVVDGNLISSRTPADLPQFMRALILALAARPVDAGTGAGAAAPAGRR